MKEKLMKLGKKCILYIRNRYRTLVAQMKKLDRRVFQPGVVIYIPSPEDKEAFEKSLVCIEQYLKEGYRVSTILSPWYKRFSHKCSVCQCKIYEERPRYQADLNRLVKVVFETQHKIEYSFL